MPKCLFKLASSLNSISMTQQLNMALLTVNVQSFAPIPWHLEQASNSPFTERFNAATVNGMGIQYVVRLSNHSESDMYYTIHNEG